MKRIIGFLILTFCIFTGTFYVRAQTELTEKKASAEASPTEVKTTVEPEIQDLKDKVATKVAELRKENKRAVAGVVTEIKEDVILLESADATVYEVNIDDSLTKAYQIGTGYKEIQISALEKDDYLIVTGPQLDNTIDASVIYRDTQFVVFSGKITEVDSSNYTVKVLTSAKETYTLDIETKTAQRMLDIKTYETSTIGFSKMKEGDTIHFAANKKAGSTQVSAIRILIIPQEYFQK